MASTVHHLSIPAPVSVPTRPQRNWTRQEYERLVELGIFGDESLELLDGKILTRGPQSTMHASVAQTLTKLFIRTLEDRAEVRVQAPFAAGDMSRPEPDIAIVPPGNYLHSLPDSAYLLIEIADTSIHFDRSLKASLYAACDVPEYWIINLKSRTVEVHADPEAGEYGKKRTYRPSDRIRLVALEGIAFEVAALLPGV